MQCIYLAKEEEEE